MQRNLAKHLLRQLGQGVYNRNYQNSYRALATVKEIFQNKSEFPTRHIGPRKTDVVSMLNLLGFKVSKILLIPSNLKTYITTAFFRHSMS